VSKDGESGGRSWGGGVDAAVLDGLGEGEFAVVRGEDFDVVGDLAVVVFAHVAGWWCAQQVELRGLARGEPDESTVVLVLDGAGGFSMGAEDTARTI
jgi:hypothetical protein